MINPIEFDEICENFTLIDLDNPAEVADIKKRLLALSESDENEVLNDVLKSLELLNTPDGIEEFGNLLLEAQEKLRDLKFADKKSSSDVETTEEELKPEKSPSPAAIDTSCIEKSTSTPEKISEPPKKIDPEITEEAQIDSTDYTELFNQDLELVQTFCEEATEHLDTIDLKIIIWEKNPACPDCVNDIFRPFHTIKGVSSFLDLHDIQRVAHALEDLLDDARSGKMSYSENLSALIFKGVDYLKSMIQCIIQNIEREEFVCHSVPVAGFVKQIRSFPRQKDQTIPLETKEENPTIETISESEKSEKTTEISIPIEPEKNTSATIEQTPPAKSIEAQPANKTRPVKEPEKNTTTASKSPENKQPPASNPPKSSPVQTAVPKSVVGTEKTFANNKTRELIRSVKIDTAKLDALIDQVGELVISNNILTQYLSTQQITDKGFLAEISQLRRIVNSLQYSSLSLRMIPIASTFQKMNRVVRDLSVKLGKELELELIGENTEIDRNIVDELYEPLVHMIRNSCDHAIESTEERLQAGKKPQGKISLEAGHRDGCIQITLKDDGRGLDTQKIRNKAIASGLIHENEELTKDEIFRLILRPGFSTAENVTDVSGRGVGMDVVVRAIEKFRGKVEIQSEPGKGSAFSIKVPLTLAIIDGMIIKVGSQQFIIPTINIRESIQPGREDYNKTMGKGEMVTVRGNLIPLIRLHQIFSIPTPMTNPWDALIVVVEGDGKNYAILVDQLLGKQEIVIKSLGEKFQGLKGVAGGAILGNGHVGLILDVPQLVQLSEQSVF
jgi:two-component system chemotaxis sensor kinase CheA